MAIHHQIIHHLNRHKERIVAHVNRHHKKYIMGAGILSGMAIFKLIGIMAIFFGSTYIGGASLGGDYYDAEWYAQEAAKKLEAETLSGCGIFSMTGETRTLGSGDCISKNR